MQIQTVQHLKEERDAILQRNQQLQHELVCGIAFYILILVSNAYCLRNI